MYISHTWNQAIMAAAWPWAEASSCWKGASQKLDGFQMLWHQMPRGKGGQEGAQIANFSPDSNYLFPAVGDRQRMTPAWD